MRTRRRRQRYRYKARQHRKPTRHRRRRARKSRRRGGARPYYADRARERERQTRQIAWAERQSAFAKLGAIPEESDPEAERRAIEQAWKDKALKEGDWDVLMGFWGKKHSYGPGPARKKKD